MRKFRKELRINLIMSVVSAMCVLFQSACTVHESEYWYVSIDGQDGVLTELTGMNELERLRNDTEMPLSYIFVLDETAQVRISVPKTNYGPVLELNLANTEHGHQLSGNSQKNPCVQSGRRPYEPTTFLRVEWLGCRMDHANSDHLVIDFSIVADGNDLHRIRIPFELIRNGSFRVLDGI